LIDTAILTGAAWVIALPLPSTINGLLSQVISEVIYTILATPYFVYGHYRYQTTLGKRVLRLYVVRADNGLRITLKQSWIRYFGYLVSYLPVGCGYLMAAFHPKKQALHDLMAGTICVREVKAESGT
jgi:uncharacterized RDD family membrane protein YckC